MSVFFNFPGIRRLPGTTYMPGRGPAVLKRYGHCALIWCGADASDVASTQHPQTPTWPASVKGCSDPSYEKTG